MTPTKTERPGIPGPAPDMIRDRRLGVAVQRRYDALLSCRERTNSARLDYRRALKEAIEGGESAAAIARLLGLSRQAVNRDSHID